MQIKLHRIGTDFKGEFCYTAPQGVVMPDGNLLVTTVPILLSGVDVGYGLESFHVDGKTFEHTPFKKHANLGRKRLPDGREYIANALSEIYHKKTGKVLLVGGDVYYNTENVHVEWAEDPRHTTYLVYDEEKDAFSDVQTVEMPDEKKYFNAGNCLGQLYEEENGDVLVPFYFKCGGYNYATEVMRCSFDGKKLTFKEVGNSITVEVPRGLCEASITKYGDEYFLCLRNDEDGYIAKSKDGLHYEAPVPLCFDDGESVGNYCTQQHWLKGGGKLWLVYTRRGADNDHVFRHRAPLFIAELNPATLKLIRSTEQIAVPNRGARLGNFSCCSESDKRGFVIASEWMQFEGGDKDGWKTCMKYGSDNSIFITEILFE